MENIQAAISPLLSVMCMCGNGVFEYPCGRRRLRFTVIYILAVWSIYTYVIVKSRLFLGEIVAADLPVNIHVNLAFMVIYALLTLYYDKKFKGCLKKLSIVNDTLEKLGTPKDYADLRARIIRVIVAWMGLIFGMGAIDSLWFLDRISLTQLPLATCLQYVVNHSLHVNALYDMMHVVMMRYIGSRFAHVNRHIQGLTEEQAPILQVKEVWTTYSSFPLIQRLDIRAKTSNRVMWILMHLHNELSSISRELNKIFGLQMLLQTAAIKVFVMKLILDSYKTFLGFYINATYQMAFDTLITIIWAVVVLGKTLMFNCACEELCGKAAATEAFLNALSNFTLDAETQENISQFLLQLLKKPLTISALGIFDFGYCFIHKFVQCTTMVIIIVLQSIQ